MLRPFQLLEPASVQEAAAELSRLGDRAQVYAGGAELLLLLRKGIVETEYLVNIKPIPGLNQVVYEGEVLSIGAAVTHRALETDALVRARWPILAEAESHIGNIRVRNQGTLGGNLCFADPHADPATALLVYEATVSVAGSDSDRRLPMDAFILGTYETALEPGQMLTSVQVPPLPLGWAGAFLRIERFYRPTANVAAAALIHDGRLEDVRLAVGCVGPKPVRLHDLEARIQGLTVPEARRVVSEAKPFLVERLEPVSDLLGSAEYKAHIASVLLDRALGQATQSEGRSHDD